MEYYSTIKKNEILSFAATWMDLEMIILSDICRQRQISCANIFVESREQYKWTHLQNRHRLGVQWLRICLPVQGTQVWPLVWEDATSHWTTKPLLQLLNLHAVTAEACTSQSPCSTAREATAGPEQKAMFATLEKLPLTATRESPWAAVKIQHSHYKEKEIVSQTEKTNWWLPKGRCGWERGKLGIWDQQTTLNKIDKQQGFTVQHRDFYSIFCNTLSWKRIWRKKC